MTGPTPTAAPDGAVPPSDTHTSGTDATPAADASVDATASGDGTATGDGTAADGGTPDTTVDGAATGDGTAADGGTPDTTDDGTATGDGTGDDGQMGAGATGAPVEEAAPAARRAALLARFRPTADHGGHRHLLTGSSVLVVGAAVQGIGGIAFSILVSKLDVKTDFGDATALFTSVLFVTYLAGLGLPVALARYAADRSEDSHVVFAWGVLATIPASIVTSALYLWLVHPHNAEVLWDWSRVGGFVLFTLVVMGSAFSLIVDVRAMTMRRWNLVLARICLVGVAKIALLPLFRGGEHRAILIFLYLGGPVAVSGFVGVAFINRITGGRHQLGPRPPTARAATRYAAINYVSTLAYQAPYFALPVIVLTHVDSATNGSFYVAWGIVAIAFYVPSAIGQALLAEGGKGGAHVQQQMRLALGLAVALMTLGTIATFLGKGLVVKAFDESYAEAAHILPAMMLAGIPWAVTSLFLTEARVLHRHVATVVITVTLTLCIIVPALILVPGKGSGHGLDGASAAWLVGNLVAAAVAVLATAIDRRVAKGDHALDELDPLAPVA